MRYCCPLSIDEAVTILAADENARCLAGGATLVAMMNADLLMPSTLVSLRAITALDGMRQSDTGFAIGAMTRHAAVASEPRLTHDLAVVRYAAQEIGHPAIRAVGTLGGSIAHADPSADYPTALVAARAEVELVSSSGTRRVPASEFFQDFFTTSLEQGEMITSIHLPTADPASGSSYLKVARSDGDFAIVSMAFCGSFEGSICSSARVAIGGCASTPINVPEIDEILVGAELGSPEVTTAAQALADACDPIDDVRGSADYRRLLVRRLLPRVLDRALCPANK